MPWMKRCLAQILSNYPAERAPEIWPARYRQAKKYAQSKDMGMEHG